MRNLHVRKMISTFKDAIRKLASLLAGRGIQVIFRGSMCCTNCDNVVVLPAVDILESSGAEDHEIEEFIKATYGFVAHEVGHVLFTNGALWKKAGREESEQVMAFFNAIEDGLVERKMLELWRGSGGSVNTCHDYCIAKSGHRYKEQSSVVQISLLVCFLVKGAAFNRVKDMFDPDIVKWVDAELDEEIAMATDVSSTDESLAIAKRIVKKIKAAMDMDEDKPEDKYQLPDMREGGSGDDADNNEDSESSESDDNSDDSGTGDDSGDGGSDEDDTADGSTAEDPDSDDADSGDGEDFDDSDIDDDGDGVAGEDAGDEQIDGPTKMLEDDGSMGASFDPPEDISAILKQSFDDLFEQCEENGMFGSGESDTAYCPYTTEDDYIGPIKRDCRADWKCYFSQYAWPTDIFKNLKDAEDEIARVVGPLKVALNRVLRARSMAYNIRNLERGQLDKRRAWRAVAFPEGPPKVYTRRMVGENFDLAVILAVNESLSMWGEKGDGARMRLAIASGLVLGDVLNQLGVKFGVLGHTTGSQHVGERRYLNAVDAERSRFTRWGDLKIEWVKHLNEPWLSSRRMMGGLSPQMNTYDAEVIRYASRCLGQEPRVSRRILIMLDDGEPCPNVYQVGARHREEVHVAVKEATKSGIEVVGVGMETATVEVYYPDSVVVHNLEELPNALLKKFGQLMNVNRKCV